MKLYTPVEGRGEGVKGHGHSAGKFCGRGMGKSPRSNHLLMTIFFVNERVMGNESIGVGALKKKLGWWINFTYGKAKLKVCILILAKLTGRIGWRR